ncbi:MAG TPA: HAD family phosphatase [Clostridiaceae bacterium]
MLTNVKGAIFDMDGTLIDSMWVWTKIDEDYLKGKGHMVPEDLRVNIEHLGMLECANYFKVRFEIEDSIEEIFNEWNQMAIYEYTHNVNLKDGAKIFLEYLKTLNIKLALATSNSKILLEAVLKNNGILDYFDYIITTDEAGNSKSSPEMFLYVSNILKLNPSECIVFEDILPAVIAAKKAGMKVVGMHDLFSENVIDKIKDNADYYFYKYEEIKLLLENGNLLTKD